MTVGGGKEAGASVELRWTVDSALQQDWTEIVARTAPTTWSHSFPLNIGQNDFELRSKDVMDYPSTPATTFSVQRNSSVATPSLDAVVSPTTVGNQVLTGTKPANTAIYNVASGSAVLLVPLDASTSWDLLANLASGSNDFELVARNASSVDSSALATPAASILAGRSSGEALPISFDIVFDRLRSSSTESCISRWRELNSITWSMSTGSAPLRSMPTRYAGSLSCLRSITPKA